MLKCIISVNISQCRNETVVNSLCREVCTRSDFYLMFSHYVESVYIHECVCRYIPM